MDEDGPASYVSMGGLNTEQIKEVVLEQMKGVIGRISKLLLRYHGRRVRSTDSVSLLFLRFLEVELSDLSELLRELPLPDRDGSYYIKSVIMPDWLEKQSNLATDLWNELYNHKQAGAIGCFCRTTTRIPFSNLFQLKKFLRDVPSIVESSCRYNHLLLADDDEITSSRMTSPLQPHPYVETAAGRKPLVGVHGALGHKVLRWFMDDHKCDTVKIISMVGPVGVGKTAIAMEVYRRLQSRGGGEGNVLCCATAKASRWPDMKKLLLHILSQIDELAALAPASIDELEQLIQKISECLQDRRYLIVIDDIWKISDWDIIKKAFPRNNQGSRIVITTRIRNTACWCCSCFFGLVHEVKPLGEVDSKMLLFRKAFGCEVEHPPENFRQVCTEILRRCEGIPLFIDGMAGWLQEQQQEMQQNSYYNMEDVPQLLQIFEQALSPTYDDLPHIMKVLVLSMSMLPECYMFETDTLQYKWEFEDLIEVNRHYVGQIEEIYIEITDIQYLEVIEILLYELINRNIITPVANWEGPTQREDWVDFTLTHRLEEGCQYKVNYFMLQFLASKSADKGFACTSGWLTSVERLNKHNEKPRRIALHRTDPDIENFLNTRDLSHTRSLAISGTVDGVTLEKFIHLIILDLEGWQSLKDEDLSLICNKGMFLLKYLSLRNTSVSRLPPEIRKLLVLHTLVASHTQISELPIEVCDLQELHSLDLRSTKIRHLPEYIWKVPSLETLLVGGDRVYCDQTISELPEGTSNRTSLTTLDTVDLSECSAGVVESLSRLRLLKVLCIRWSFRQCTDPRVQEALCSCIQRCADPRVDASIEVPRSWFALRSRTRDCD